MKYDLTPEERKKYIAARGKTIVTACPGSGKTTSIVYKLHQISSEVEKNSCHSGVLCLSFTNKAVDEIKSSYNRMHGSELRYPHDVSTIDSFLTQNIVIPYWYLFPDCKSYPIIVNEEKLLHTVLWHHYINDGKEGEICNIRSKDKLQYKYAPEHINYCGDKFYYKAKELPIETFEYAREVLTFRLGKGYLTSSDAMYIALNILRKYPIISESIVKRYSYIIVDEAQDTSYDQYCLLAEFLKAGLQNIEFVGDINQSIYEWRYARPDILEKLSNNENWNHIPFVNNRRSVQRIIDLYSKLVPSHRRQNVVSTDVVDANIPITVYKYDSSNSLEILSDFEKCCKDKGLKEWLILTRGRSLGKQLSGAKDKPEYWKTDVPYIILRAYQDFKDGAISEAVQQLAYVWSTYLFKENDYESKKVFVKETTSDSAQSTMLVNMFFKMPDLSETFASWTQKMPIFLKESWNLDKIPVFEVFKFKKYSDIKLMARTKLSSYFSDDIKHENNKRKILTIHASKGASTDAVLLFLSSNNSGKQISLSLFEKNKEMSEKHRLLYVACSRARQFLALAVPMNYPDAKIRKMLDGTNFIIKTPGVIEGLF